MVRFGHTTNGGEKTLLPAFPKNDVLPAEEAGIDGPGAGPDHSQSGGQDRLHDGNPGIARMREIQRQSDPHFNDGRQRSRHRTP